MSRPYVGDHDMEEILRLTGEDTFAGRGRDRGSLRNYRYDSGLSESVQPLDVQMMLEETTPMTDDQVIATLQAKLAALLPNAEWNVFKMTFLGTDVLVDVLAVPPGASKLDQANAKFQVRFALSGWHNGVPVGPPVGGKPGQPTDGKVVLQQVRNRDVPKLSKRTTTVAKAVDTVVAWVAANAEMFSPKTGWAHTARGYESNMESVWQDTFPTVNPVDDFESWAAARDDKNDKTPAGVMGESSGPPYTGLVLDLDYHPSSSGGRVTIGNGLLPAQQSALAAVQKELDATFGTTVIKRVAGSLSLHVKDGSPAALVAALRKIGKALGMELSKTLKESRDFSLRELAESGGRGTRRPAPLKEVPITGSPKQAVEELDRLLKSLRG
jgi:hypothetical protein